MLHSIKALRQLCRETSKPQEKALLYFEEGKKTGIARAWLIIAKDKDFIEASMVKVNW